jgi:hypothetical protein
LNIHLSSSQQNKLEKEKKVKQTSHNHVHWNQQAHDYPCCCALHQPAALLKLLQQVFVTTRSRLKKTSAIIMVVQQLMAPKALLTNVLATAH